MSIEAASGQSPTALLRRVTTWLYRTIAVLLFVVGVHYWVRLLGIDSQTLGRFDLMPVWWKMAAPTLAVLYPVAGMGLWLLAGWGAVIWMLIALVETLMHIGFADLFGRNYPWLAFHGFGLLVLVTLRVVYLRERRRAPLTPQRL